MVSVEIEGLDQLDSALAAKLEEFRSELEQVVADTAEGVRDEARSLVPVDTGTLQDGIGADINGLEAEVGVFDDEAYYGFYIEFGTTTRPANPYLGPAAEIERGRMEQRLREALK